MELVRENEEIFYKLNNGKKFNPNARIIGLSECFYKEKIKHFKIFGGYDEDFTTKKELDEDDYYDFDDEETK